MIPSVSFPLSTIPKLAVVTFFLLGNGGCIRWNRPMVHALLPTIQSSWSSYPCRIRLTSTTTSRLTFSSSSPSSTNTANADGADDRRQQSLQQGHQPLISLNLNLDALAQQGAAPRAQELLQRIHALYQEGYYEVSPDIVSYNSVLKAWKEMRNPQQALELLQDMIDQCHAHAATSTTSSTSTTTNTNRISLRSDAIESTIRPDIVSFNTVILAFAQMGDYPQAFELLRQMIQDPLLPQPDTITYNAVLYALAQSSEAGAALRAETLFKEMMQPSTNVTVDTTSFNTVLYAWARLAAPTYHNQYHPNVPAAQRAHDLLDHMEWLHQAGNTNVQPDVYSYTTVIQAWAICEKPTRAQEVLDRMITATNIQPNRHTYTAVMSSLAKAGRAEQAEIMLQDMVLEYQQGKEDMKPDTVAYSSVMDGWAKVSCVDKPYAADRALALLSQMKKQFQETGEEDVAPNEVTYTSVLTALAKSGTWHACERARLILLNELEQDPRLQNRISNIHYNTVLNAYARSPRADKALKAAALLEQMKQHPNPACHPDTISYNSLLLACANAFGNDELKRESFTIALDAFKIVLTGPDPSRIEPTSTTFAHFCKAARRLLNPAAQKSVVAKTFRLCCNRGLVNKIILQHVQRVCDTDEEWKEMLQNNDAVSKLVSRHCNEPINIHRLPHEWICNARR